MKILYITGPVKKKIMQSLCNSILKNHGIEYKLMIDRTIVPKSRFKRAIGWIRLAIKLKPIIKEFNPDYILTDYVGYLMILKNTNVPVILRLVGDAWTEMAYIQNKSMIGRKIRSFANNMIYEGIEKTFSIVTVSRYLENITRKRYPDKKIITIYNGVDSEGWTPTSSKRLKHPCVGLLQNAFIYDKTKEMLVMEDVIKSLSGITFYWAGHGGLKSMVLDKLNKYENFVYLGELVGQEVKDYLSEIDVYVLASGLDMFPSTVFEAQLMKRPVIATSVGGVPEMITDGETGFLVDKGNPEQIIERIQYIFDNPQKSEWMAQAGCNFVKERLSWDNVTKNFTKIFEKD